MCVNVRSQKRVSGNQPLVTVFFGSFLTYRKICHDRTNDHRKCAQSRNSQVSLNDVLVGSTTTICTLKTKYLQFNHKN